MHHLCGFVLFALIGFAGNARLQTPPPVQTDESQSFFSANLDFVVLNATVRDKKGWFVPDLTQPDFEVFEDRLPQTIRLFRHEDIAVTVELVVDHSGSMRPKLAALIAAAQTFVVSSRTDDHMFVVNVNDTVTLEGFAQPGQLAQAIASKPTMGKTALYDAVNKALEQLKAWRTSKEGFNHHQ